MGVRSLNAVLGKLLIVTLLVLVIAPAPATTRTATPSVDDLMGLWKAKKRFGPDARGLLVVERSGTTYTANMMGRTIALRNEKSELTLDLPNGQGTFRGKLEPDGSILGHWFAPPSAALSVGTTYASPVRLAPEGRNRWRGQVVPFDDEFTLYLRLQKLPDGSLSAFLRNFERDYGNQIGVERLALNGSQIKLIGKRAGQKDERELASGTYDSETKLITIVFPARGGIYEFKREGDASDFYPRGRTPEKYVYQPPLSRDDGWPTSTLAAASIDRAEIEKFIQMILDMPMESGATPQVEGVLIARHGKLVLEEYFHGQHRDKLHETRSAAKSVTSVVVGAAIQAGAPLKLSSRVYEVMDQSAATKDIEPRKRAMTLEHLLTMSSGYFCDDTDPKAPGNEENVLDGSEPDYYRFTLNLPMASTPGEKSVYCSINPNLALGMVGQATGESPMYSFDRLIGGPLKINRYGWPLDPAGHPYGGGGVQLLPRDFMKLGQLMLNRGVWQRRRVLSADFVARASAPLYHLRNIYYGYFWWGIDYPYKNRTVHAYFAGGAGGQAVMIIPELDLVVAVFAGNYNNGRTAIHVQQNLVPRHILPAVREPGDMSIAIKPEKEYVTPYGRSPISGPVIKK